MTKSLLKKIYNEMAHSMYRMNASGCNYYAFTIIGKSWEGTYAYSPMKLYGFENCMNLTTGKLVDIKHIQLETGRLKCKN